MTIDVIERDRTSVFLVREIDLADILREITPEIFVREIEMRIFNNVDDDSIS